jgi:hypothetical protein
MGRFRFHPDDYGALLRSELPAHERLQDEAPAAAAARGAAARGPVRLVSPNYDLPSRPDEQLTWLRGAGLDAAVVWAERDLAVIVAVKPSASAAAG